jgi:hypothetical protein
MHHNPFVIWISSFIRASSFVIPAYTYMQFIETTGAVLARIVNEGEISPADLAKSGVTDDTIVRINRQGDIEVRRRDRWDVIGGLLGNFEIRARQQTGLDWA